VQIPSLARPSEDIVKLYEATLSPFAARVRAQLYAKGLDVERVAPPGGLGSDEYKRINPTGRVPALVLDDGNVLPESTVIAEYLEDRFPEPPLRPADPAARARMRLLIQLADHYVFPALHALYPQVLDPPSRDASVVAAGFAALEPHYDVLARFVGTSGPYALGGQLTLADCALFPIFFFATRVHQTLGAPDPTASRPPLGAWWKSVALNPAIHRVDVELEKALAEMMRGGAPS
jgi:glutathione S-transferase